MESNVVTSYLVRTKSGRLGLWIVADAIVNDKVLLKFFDNDKSRRISIDRCSIVNVYGSESK